MKVELTLFMFSNHINRGNNMTLVIDDMRDLGGDVICRTAAAARAILTTSGFHFECVCFDHDLGTEETGYDVLKYGLESQTLPHHIQLVSMNPVGLKRMSMLLKDYSYFSNNNVNFYLDGIVGV
jgi:hypothetical protein